MDTNEIKRLINAFYKGETSVEEEKLLQDYFSGENISEEFIEEKDIFISLYCNIAPIDVPTHLEEKLNNLIDELAAKELAKTEIKLHQNNKQRFWIYVGGIAAGIALIISTGIYINKKTETTSLPVVQVQTETVSKECEQKIKAAQDALVLLSSKFNQGTNKLSVVSANIDKTNKILNKTLNI